MEMSEWESHLDGQDFNQKVENLHGTLEAACMELAASQNARRPSERTRAFRQFVDLFERARKQFERLPDE